MILQIDENYRITSDSYNFMLQRKHKSKNGTRERWSTLCYCKTLDQVLESARDEQIKNLGQHTPEEFLTLLHALTQEIRSIGERCVDLWGKDTDRK